MRSPRHFGEAVTVFRASKDSPEAMQVADVILASRCAFLPYAVSPHTDTETRAWVRDVLFDSEEVFVAVTDGVVVGMMTIQHATTGEPAVDWLNQMYVLPEHVGRGTGSALLDVALKSIRHSLRLFTFQQSAGARRSTNATASKPSPTATAATTKSDVPMCFTN